MEAERQRAEAVKTYLYLRAFGRDEVKASERHVFSQTARAPYRWTKPLRGDVVIMDSSSETRTVRWDIEEPVDVRVDAYRGSVRLDVEVEASRWSGDLSCVEGIVTVTDASWLLDIAGDSTVDLNASAMWSMDLREMYRAVSSGMKDGPPDPGTPSKQWLFGVFMSESNPMRHYLDVLDALGWERVSPLNAGATTTWTAAGAGNWNTGANWTGGSEPATNDDVVFNGTSTQTCTINVSTNALTSFSVNSGFTGIINADTDQGGTVAKHGVGTFAAAFSLNSAAGSGAQVLMFSDFTMSAGTVAITAGRQFRTSGTINISAGTWTSGNYITQNTASANVTISITMTFILFAAATNDVTFTLQANLTYSVALHVEHFTTTKTVTLAAVATTITGTGSATLDVSTGAQIGTNRPGAITFTTGTLDTGTGAVTVGNATAGAGTLGSNTAWTFTQDGAYTQNATGTTNAPTGTGWTAGGNIDISAGTFNADSGTIVVNANINFSSQTGTTNLPYNITINLSKTCTQTSGARCSNVLTVNGTLTGASYSFGLYSGSATPLVVGGSGSVSGIAGMQYIGTVASVNVAAATYSALTLFSNFAGVTTYTPAGNIVCTAFSFGNNTGAILDVYAGGTTTLTGSGTLTVGQAASNYKGSLQFSTGTCTGFTTSTVNAGSDITYSGAGTYTQTQEMTLNGSVSWNAATVSIASGRNVGTFGVGLGASATWTGGSGAHTLGSFDVNASGAAWTATSGTATVNGKHTNGDCIRIATGTFSHGSGTTTLTFATTPSIDMAAAATFYNLTWNSSGAGSIYNNSGSALLLTVANNLTISQGSLTTLGNVAQACNLTVTNATSITGTLTCNGSTISLNSAGTSSSYGVTINNGGTLTGGSGAHTYGSIFVSSSGSTTTWTATSSTTTVNGRQSGGTPIKLGDTAAYVFTHSSGTVDITQAVGTGLIEIYITSPTFNNLTLTGAVTHQLYTATNAKTCTVAGNLVVTAGTFDCVSGAQPVVNLTVTGTSSVTGTLTPDTATITLNGAATVNSGGTFGSNTAYVLDSNAAFTVSGGGTFNSASSGNMTHSGNLTGSTTMTWNQNGGTTVLDGTTQVLSGFTSAGNTTVLGNLNIQTSSALSITSGVTQLVGNNQSVVLTLNMAGAIGSDGSSTVVLRVDSSNTNPIVATSMPTSWTGGSGAGAGSLRIEGYANYNVPAMTFTNGNTLRFGAATSSITATMTGNLSIVTAGALVISSLSASITGYTFAQNTRTITTVDTFTVGTASGAGLATHTTTTGSTTVTSTTAEAYLVHQDSLSGSNTAWTLDCNAWLSVRSGGTLNAPNASGTFTWGASGAITMRITGTYNADSGLVTMDGSGAMTWAPGSNTFYDMTVSGSGGVTEATSGTGSGTGTVSNVLTVNASRTFTMDNTAITLTLSGSGTPFVLSGTFAPGTAATVAYTGSSATNITGTTYYNVTVNQSGTTFTQAANVTANGNISITAGTWVKTDRAMTWTGTATVAGTLSDLNTGFSQSYACTGGAFNLTTGTISVRMAWWVTVSGAGSTNVIYVPEDQTILYNCTMTNIVLIKTVRKGRHKSLLRPLGGGMQGL